MMCFNFFCCEDADNTLIDGHDASLKEQGTLRDPSRKVYTMKVDLIK